jgi:hypothetical protein
MSDTYKIKISPETIVGDLAFIKSSGETFGVYSAMTQVVSAGPNGSSTLTGLTIPILLKQTTLDAGYYSPFDGAIYQKDVVTNFLVSANTVNPYTFNLYNTSEQYQKFIELSSYSVDWGDGTREIVTGYTPNFVSHTYPTGDRQYTITLSQINPWGKILVQKPVQTPFKTPVVYNPKGRVFFQSNIGSWSATPVSYDYIFSGDQYNQVSSQISSNFVTVPYMVSGETKSRITELYQYGPVPYKVGVPVIKNREIFGVVNSITPIFTAYTIQNIDYYDYKGGLTIFFMESSGFTEENITAVPITKDELLLKITDQGQIQTDIFVERGKNSAFERIQRLGEIDNLGDLINYGYGFFNVEKKT